MKRKIQIVFSSIFRSFSFFSCCVCAKNVEQDITKSSHFQFDFSIHPFELSNGIFAGTNNNKEGGRKKLFTFFDINIFPIFLFLIFFLFLDQILTSACVTCFNINFCYFPWNAIEVFGGAWWTNIVGT